MQQLKLDLNPRKKVSGMKEVFQAILAGEVSQILFFKWVRARERAEYYKGYNAGYNAGYKEGVPKERYQGEFGPRGNY